MPHRLLHWGLQGVGILLAAVVAYFTTIGAIQTSLAVVKQTEQDHYQEILRHIDNIETDIRDMRDHPRH